MEFGINPSLNPELLSLSLDKIQEFIHILEEKEMELEANSEFSQAARVREKIGKFAELKISKMAMGIKADNEQRIKFLREERELELSMYKAESNEQKKEIGDKGDQMLDELSIKHKNENEAFNEDFETSFLAQNPSTTKDILDLNKRLEFVIKKKDYDTAHKYKEEIQKLTELNDRKWNEDVKAKRYQAGYNRIIQRQTQESNFLKNKIMTILKEFDKKRNIDIEKIERKYRNKERELVNELNCRGNMIISNSIKTVGKNDLNLQSTFKKKKSQNGNGSSITSMTI